MIHHNHRELLSSTFGVCGGLQEGRSMSNATATIQPNTVLRGHSCAVQCVSFHQEEPLLASGDSEGLIKLWDLQTMRPVLSKRLLPQSQGVLRVACGDGWLLAQARDGLVSIWDVESKAVVSATPSFDVHTGYYGFCRVSYTENLRLAIPGDATGSIELWDGKKNAKIGSLAPKEEDKLGMSMAVKVGYDGVCYRLGYFFCEISSKSPPANHFQYVECSAFGNALDWESEKHRCTRYSKDA